MTNKKKECECKKLCIDCRHHYNAQQFIGEYISPCCRAYQKKPKKSCIDGSVTASRVALCENHNKNGLCKKFAPLPHIILIRILEEFGRKESLKDYFMRDTPKLVLLKELIKVLKDEQSQLLDNISTGDTPYDSAVVVSKEAIERSLKERGYKLGCQAKGKLYGECGVETTEEERSKEWSWINAVKKALGLSE